MIRSLTPPLVFAIALSTLSASFAEELPLPVADLQRTEPVDFAGEIMPILKRNCLACHHEKEAEGGLILETAEAIHQGGDGGSSVNLEDPIASLLLVRATGAEEPLMPPEDNAVGAKTLTPDELGLLKLWIQQGAKGSDGMSESIQWQEIPESVRTSLAVEITPDGQSAVLARGNRVAIIDMATYEVVDHLVDPEVPGGNASHVDLVQSLAVSPDSQRIATGGFRTVKLWKQAPALLSEKSRLLAGAGGLVAIKSDQSAAAWVNPIGDIEVWDLGQSQRLHTLGGHVDRVSGLAWASSADRLISCDASGRVIAWRASTGEQQAESETSAALVDLAVSDDGQHLAAIDVTGKLHRLQINAEGTAIESVPQIPEGISQATSVCFASQEGPLLIVADQAAGVFVVSAANHQVVRKIDHGSTVDALAVSPDQSRLYTGGRDGKTRVWNLANGEAVMTLEGDPQANLQLVYAQRESQRQKQTVERLNGQTAELEKRLANENEVLAKATEEQKKAMTSVEENEKKRTEAAKVVEATEAAINQAKQEAAKADQMIEDSKQKLVSATAMMDSLGKELETETNQLATANGEVEKVKAELAAVTKKLEEAETRAKQIQQKVDEKKTALNNAKEAMTTAQAAIEAATKMSAESKAAAEKASKDLEPQQKNLASAEEAKKNSETELAKRQQALDTATQAQKRAESAIPAHKSVIDSETRRQLILDQQLAQSQQLLSGEDHQVLGIAVSPDQKLVATTHRDRSVRIYRADNGRPVSRFEASSLGLPEDTACVAWLGADVIGYGTGSPPQMWSTRTDWILERTIGAIDDPTTLSDRVTALDFRQDGLSLAVGSGPPSRSGEVKVFGVESGQLVRDFGEVHSDSVLGLSFSPRGRFIASSAADKTIRLLDVTTGEVNRSLEGHTHHVLSIAWQDDEQSIASASADRTVKVWDAETGEQRRTISGFGKEITALTFVAASNQLATACADGQVRLYDVSNGNAIRTFNASGDFLFALAVSLDGKTLLASGQSGVLRIWNVEDAKLLQEVK